MSNWFPAHALPPHLLSNTRVVPRREDILPLVPRGGVFCEVGVALGDYSAIVLKECEPSAFIAIDIFTLQDYREMWGGRVGAELAGRDHATYFRSRFADSISRGVTTMLIGNSTEMLAGLPDHSVDTFYVDAHHSYEAVSAELGIIKDKVRPGGLIILNDYIMHDYTTDTMYGVVQATNAFMVAEDWEMVCLALHTGMFCDVALRKYVG